MCNCKDSAKLSNCRVRVRLLGGIVLSTIFLQQETWIMPVHILLHFYSLHPESQKVSIRPFPCKKPTTEQWTCGLIFHCRTKRLRRCRIKRFQSRICYAPKWYTVQAAVRVYWQSRFCPTVFWLTLLLLPITFLIPTDSAKIALNRVRLTGENTTNQKTRVLKLW